MMWTVRHQWTARARFVLNLNRNLAQLLLRQPGEPAVTILSREGVNQGDPLLMVLYGINLIPLVDELIAVDSRLIYPFYADHAVFDGLA